VTAIDDETSLIDNALEWARRGALVIPLHHPTGDSCSCNDPTCPSVGKHPRTARGLTDASSDPNTITAWWTRWPQANIGVRTGYSFDVIDLDGGDAIDKWRAWTADIGQQPELLGIALSGRTTGGLHLYTNGGGMKTVPSGKRGLPTGVEIKGVGGYVVAPGSLHQSGARYRWANNFGDEIIGNTPWNLWYPAHIQPTATTTAGTVHHPPPDSGHDTTYGIGVLRGACERLAAATEGTRWNTLVGDAVSSVARAICGGAITDTANAAAALQNAARSCGLTDSETNRIPDLLDEFVANGATKPLTGDDPETPQLNAFHPAADTNDADWWDERPILAHIRQHARARMVSPTALLTICLVRISVTIPHTVKIPPIVGGHASLNLFGSLVGPSGAGKSAATSASDELLPTAEPWTHIGSGEGLLHTFVQRTMVKDHPDQPARPLIHQHTYAAAGIIDEVDTLTALGNRQGATLLPTLRTMWSGGAVGFGYADPAKRLNLQAHQYRLGLIIGAQPTRCAALFDDADAGTPQRILWASLADPGAPDALPESPGPIAWEIHPTLRSLNPQITLCDTIINTVIEARRHVLRTGDTGGIDGHAQLNRIKVATILCIVDGRRHVTDDDWRIAGNIQEASDTVRSWVAQQLDAERSEVVNRRVHVETRIAAAVDDERHNGRVARLARRIGAIAAASEGGRIGIGKLRARVSSADRDLVEEAVEEAVRRRLVVVESWINQTNGESVVGVRTAP
jgi:hypothetical protein